MKLRCTMGPLQNEVFDLSEDQKYVLGREPQMADHLPLVLPSRTVSRTHCRIHYADGRFLISDLQSSNGIRINRQQVQEGVLTSRDLIQIGEFTFIVEQTREEPFGGETQERGSLKVALPTEANQSVSIPVSSMRKLKLPSHLQRFSDRFSRLDISKKVLIFLFIFGFISHWLVTTPLLSDVRRSLLQQSFQIAQRAVRSMGERNKRELAEASFFLLDCDFLKSNSEVTASYLLDARGKVVCPIGVDLTMDALTENALFRGEGADNCDARILAGGESDCDLVFPVREFKEQQGQYVTVGISRITYRPLDAEITLQKLRSLSFKTLIFFLLILGLVGWLIVRMIRQGIESATENIRLAVAGNTQNVENIESFAALDPLMVEVNRLISKSNQGVSRKNEDTGVEASFLHILLQQVMLLEDRAVMVVDRDNHFVAASSTLDQVIPVNMSRLNDHITEVIEDSHLQGELMGFLNDLSGNREVMDRSLSMADRVVQVRGMPLFLHEEYAASILIF